ncbi:hypothetical protein ACFCW2_03350 [Qipengyuania sp. DSG2-2]|uniref:hypothetical protein n=1 Tax=Qipengyuania sp. DGS2-2 TaxID=3349631 RepID=UPI0036D41F84
MNDITHDSDRILREAQIVRDDNRAGGRHRKVSIGQGSKRIKRTNWVKRIRNVMIAIFAIWVAGGIAGAILNGIGVMGVMALALMTVIAVAVLANYPKVKIPKRADINKGDARQLVGKTELWLESQRLALPPPAAKVVEDMGVQLDALGLQLEAVPQDHPATREVRQLVGETLPEMIDSYRKIPANLRAEKRAGATPDQQLTEGLGKISKEIDHVTRQLAEGSLDDLAVKHRYLDYKYGDPADPVKEG